MSKYLIRLLLTGAQVLGKAFTRALKQEYEASQRAAENMGRARTQKERTNNQRMGISLEEAKQILDIAKLDDKAEIERRFQKLFDANEKSNGGTFYIQSKIVRAKERIDLELKGPKSDQSDQHDKAKT